ncbi:MAG: ABC transporter substrate-binding protein [Candidatus Verstraetearchaeota archaeon]|nr:ABC transporter substrate-binding protein [Candidatus Verstraetearchaeota archaeon]
MDQKGKALALIIATIITISSVGILFAAGYLNNNSPIEIVDMAGRTVKVNATVSRVVILESYWTEIACVLGAQDNIVGIGSYVTSSVFIPDSVKNKTVVGNVFSGVNIETVLSLQPDLVIMDYGYGKASDIVASLESAGIPVVTLFAKNFGDITNATAIIGKVFGKTERAQALVNYMNALHTQLLSNASKIPVSERPRVLICNLDVWKDGLIYTYSNTSWGNVVVDVGGINVAHEGFGDKSWVKVNMEQVLLWNPDIIVVVGRTQSVLESQISSMNDSTWLSLNAVRGGRVYPVLTGSYDLNSYLDWTPRMVVGELELAGYIQPAHFASLNWTATKEQLLTNYYGYLKG